MEFGEWQCYLSFSTMQRFHNYPWQAASLGSTYSMLLVVMSSAKASKKALIIKLFFSRVLREACNTTISSFFGDHSINDNCLCVRTFPL